MKIKQIIFLTLILCSITNDLRSQNIAMFWNVENYFDILDDEGKDDYEYLEGGERTWTWGRFIKKRNGIAQTIISTNILFGNYPSIIGLAEVENKFVLNQLIYETPLAKLDYGIIHIDSPDQRGIDVAMLYKRNIFFPKEIDCIYVPLPDSTEKTRDILYVKGYSSQIRDTLHIFINHWPSKWGGANLTKPKRMAAAKVLKNKIDSILNHLGSAKIIVMGDFNEISTSETMRFLLCGGKMIDHSDSLLKAGRGTIRYRGNWELIDIFITTKNLDGEMYIYSPEFLVEEDDVYLGHKPFRTYRGPIYIGGYSDHFPIILKY